MDRFKKVAVLSPQDLDTLQDDDEAQTAESLQVKTYFGGYDILRGVCQFARTHDEWNVYYAENSPAAFERYIRHARPDGIIAGITSPEFRRILEQSGTKVVNYGNDLADPGFPSVYEDNAAIGRLAAKHLLERGLKRAVYIGYPGYPYSDLRLQGFNEQFETKGHRAHAYPPRDPSGRPFRFNLANQDLCRWLREIEKPFGIYCCIDRTAFNIAATCRALEIRVPEEVALVGTGDLEIVCDMCRPPLTSIRYSRERIGFLAAKLLHKLMAGKPAPAKPRLIPPTGITLRQSSDLFALEDKDLLTAIKLIHEHALSPLSIDDIFAKIPISRRYLEMKFRRKLNKSPLDEILRVRLDKAKQLLAETNQTLAQIAHATGFNNNVRLSLVFKQKESITPGEFRRRAKKSL